MDGAWRTLAFAFYGRLRARGTQPRPAARRGSHAHVASLAAGRGSRVSQLRASGRSATVEWQNSHLATLWI